jgi:hypothetical protein
MAYKRRFIRIRLHFVLWIYLAAFLTAREHGERSRCG